MTIKWKQKRDRFVEGEFTNGRSWIRVNKENKVDSMYLKVNELKRKFIPETSEEQSIEFAQLRIEIELEKVTIQEKLISKLGV
jgi:hypothetical protein